MKYTSYLDIICNLCFTMLSSWSALMSKSLQVASSDPVANAFPFGKNWEIEVG